MKKFLVTVTDVLEIHAKDADEARDIADENTGRMNLVQKVEEVEEF